MAEYRLYVTDSARNRIARIDDWQQLTVLSKFNDVGKWTLRLPADSEPAQLLTRLGGIAVERNGAPFFSGARVDRLTRSWQAASGVHTREFSGSDDNAYLARSLALPVPAGPPYNTAAYDEYSDVAEQVLRHYVDVNIGPGAKAERRVAGLVLGAEISRNLCLNGGFETAGSGGPDVFANWSEGATDGTVVRAITMGEYRGGAAAAKLTCGATTGTGAPRLSQRVVGVTPGDVWAFTVWTRGDGANAGRIRVVDETHGVDIIPLISTGITGTEFARYLATIVVPAGCAQLLYYVYAPGVNGGVAYFDDTTVRRGTLVREWGRMDDLLELLQGIALRGGGLGFRVVRTGAALEFQVYEPSDKSDLVVFSKDNGTLDGFEVVEEAPAANYVIAGGSGSGTARAFVETSDPSSIVRWGRRIERFIDQQQTSDTGELFKACTEELTRNAERISISLQPAETEGLKPFTHYNLGDRVRVDLPDQTIVDVVRGFEITVTPDGEAIKPVIGTSESLAAASPLAGMFARMRELESRLSALERR